MEFKDKVVLVTGAGAGIGKAACLMYANEGAKVVANDMAECGNETVAEIEALGGTAVFVQGDISNADFSKRMIETAVKTFGRIDILVNVAGIVLPGTIHTVTEAEFDKTMAVNVKGAFFASQAAAGYMTDQGGGTIVIVASTAGLMGCSNRLTYSTSKGALIAMSKSMAADLAGTHVRVNVICPGTVNTPSMERRFQAMVNPEQAKADFNSRQLNGRIGEPEEIARAILFASNPNIQYLNGAVIAVDDGMTCCTSH